MSALYTKAKEKFWGADIDWLADDIKACLIDAADYTANMAADEFLGDIPGAAIVSTSSNMGSKTTTAGVVDCADFSFSLVSGDECEAVVFYKDTGSAATSPLIAYFDGFSPITPNGSNISVQINASGLWEM